MNSLTTPATRSSALPVGARRSAFGQIVLNEIRLTWRRPVGLIGGVAVPVLLLVIFGSLPAFNIRSKETWPHAAPVISERINKLCFIPQNPFNETR